MRILTYRSEADWRAGFVLGDQVVDVASVAEELGMPATEAWSSVKQVIQLGPVVLELLLGTAATVAERGDGLEQGSLRLGPPIPDPDKILCLALNYANHASEVEVEPPVAPALCAKYRNTLVGHGDSIVMPPSSAAVDYEGELAVVIGRPCRAVDPGTALDYVAGYTALNDVSARDVQMRTSQWLAGKAFDTFAPCGPVLVSADEIADVQNLSIATLLNGEAVQQASTADMIFDVASAIAYISAIIPLAPGDIIATGTPEGVGYARDPQVFLAPGDRVEVVIESIGTLANGVTLPDRQLAEAASR